MPWFYVDDGFSDSKPVLNMPDRHRLAACGLWVLAGSWSAKEELDGFVPTSKLRQLGARPTIIAALTDPGRMSAPLCDRVDGGIQFNSWEKWQKTRAELHEKRLEDAARQRAWREQHPDGKKPQKLKGRNAVTSTDPEKSQRDTAVTNAVTNNVTNAVTNTRVTTDASRARARRPDPTRPDPSSNEDFGGEPHPSNDTTPPPCPRHPNGYNHDQPCRPCQRLREHDETQTTQQAREHQYAQDQARLTQQAAINACTHCDPQGLVNMPDLIGDGTHPTQCPHNPQQIHQARQQILATRQEMANQ